MHIPGEIEKRGVELQIGYGDRDGEDEAMLTRREVKVAADEEAEEAEKKLETAHLNLLLYSVNRDCQYQLKLMSTSHSSLTVTSFKKGKNVL